MKIVLPGGSGQVGTILARAFHREGHAVLVLSRNPKPAPWTMLHWDGRTIGPWAAAVDGSDVVVNLAGRNVNCRYTPANQRLIMQSRLDSTLAVGQAIQQAASPPSVWLQSSTATIYAHRFDAYNDEDSGVIGGDEPDAPASWGFSIAVARAWEAAAGAFDLPNTRLALLRSAIVLSPDRGGIFDVLLGLVRRGLGGRSGNGRQYVSWIQDRDFERAVQWIIQQDSLEGPINLCSPNPLPNAEFMAAIRSAWGVRVGLPATAWMLELGALFMRTETELILKSRRVYPKRMLNSGFAFDFPDWRTAAEDLCARHRATNRPAVESQPR